ncbi:MAG: molybdenum cofactor cytidylyltransferase [Deltaproteobacteria bacterium]|nr:molybdenum cofactor cytidylyltransferase [Deltaproteobacteria bacterium]MBW2052472.1 molybdenum cofactor cytidylyltransferase [Deltaproteobacteria bacterium]MBW2141496.1 molybdenum cofactor cytidylyltransferase [Deltaproteobacteria bacterium]MBW2323570.1 molybdenum cofactor cytidylyltransferase [Deltaproteobacteria bacterium]
MTQTNKRVSGIILAAGGSKRINGIKQLLQFEGKPILGWVVENALKSSLSRVIVVLGHAAEEIQKAVDLKKAKLVVNDRYDRGQSSSIQAGLNVVPDQDAGVMFLLGDQPLVRADVINTLIEAYQNKRSTLVIPTRHGRRGNPVLIDRSLFPRLESLTGDVGARVLFEEYAGQIREIEVESDGILFDVDTWDDYIELKKKGLPLQSRKVQ